MVSRPAPCLRLMHYDQHEGGSWGCFARQYPPTPAFAKAGAAPGTTAGVELVFLSFKCLQPLNLKLLTTLQTLQKLLGTPNRAGKSYPKATSIASSGGPACRSPGVTGFKPFACLIPQPTSTPRPHPSLLLGGPACRSPGVTGFKPFQRLHILLACLIPRPTSTPRPQLLMGVQTCRLPALKPLKPLKPPKRLKTLKTLKTLQKLLGTPNRAGKSYPKATSIASSGRSSLPFARRYRL